MTIPGLNPAIGHLEQLKCATISGTSSRSSLDGNHECFPGPSVRMGAMSHDEVVAKSRDLMAPILGAATCTKLVESVLGLEHVKDIRELRPSLQRA